MSHKYFFIVTPFTDEAGFRAAFPDEEYRKPPRTLFIYETENNNDVGKYTAYSSDKSIHAYWNDWLARRYYEPSRFVNRFGYSGVKAGKIRDATHLRELFERCEIPYPETSR